MTVISDRTMLFITAVLLLALAGFYWAVPVRVLKAVLFHDSTDPYFADFRRGLLAACKQLGVVVEYRHLPDPELDNLAYRDALSAESPQQGVVICRVPDAATAATVANLNSHAIVVRSQAMSAALPDNVVYHIHFDYSMLFAALQAAAGPNPDTLQRSVVAVVDGDPTDYVPTAWTVLKTTRARLMQDLMPLAVSKTVGAVYVMNSGLLTPDSARVCKEIFPLAKLCAAGYVDPNVDFAFGFDAYEQGYLAAMLYKRLADKQPVNTWSRDVYTRVLRLRP